MSPPHTANGDHADAEEENDLAARTRARANTVDVREVATEALVVAVLGKRHILGIGTTLSDLHERYGQIVGSNGRLAEAAKQGREELRDQMRDGFVRLETLLTAHVSRTEKIFEERDRRITALEEKAAAASSAVSRAELASITNELDAVENTGVRNILKEAQAHNVIVLERMKAENEVKDARIAALEKAQHDDAIVSAALATDATNRDLAMDRREKRLKDRTATLATLVGLAIVLWAVLKFVVKLALLN